MIYDVGNAVLPFVGGFTVRFSRTALTVRCMYCVLKCVYTLNWKTRGRSASTGKTGKLKSLLLCYDMGLGLCLCVGGGCAGAGVGAGGRMAEG